ncbi:glycosyl hydrolase family 28-related protein [Pseudooceanicola onchidii]|uniref:glycosyl hydrolase family 28-related protein n=1 Tax=Pseudooceanicola onchidii TaxID=2562279 RepID=UPI0010AAF7BD|nr:glycosyl hydrolase family 28-related protein [Pseudooceanicola onchidii]
MNKAITDGIGFMPPAFDAGLGVWSSGDGTSGSDTYAGSPDAALVPADQDFGGCLEILKSSSTQKLRYMGQTPILPGCYLRITARVKAVAGALPSVRIAGWAGRNNDVHVGGLVEATAPVTLTSYGEVVEVQAIVGTGNRPGVDMAWGTEPTYGYFGVDLTGANGGTVRIDDLVIEDVTSVFLRDMMAWVDVRDYGARGDGVSNDRAAFAAADAAANGRQIMVPAGVFHLADSIVINSRIQFEGTVTMPTDKILSLTKNFDLPAYIDAFGDEELAFKKAFQALLNNTDHESLDLGGRRIGVTEPIDMQAAVANKDSYATRRQIHNGQFECIAGPAWDTTTVTSQASYAPSNALKLTGVTNVANIPVGSLVTASGVGREVYVRSVNIGAQEVTLSKPLYDAAGTQTYTFKRFKYLLDFSGFSRLDKFGMSNIEFQCWGDCSAILLAPTGVVFHLRDCFITRPRDRGITSHGQGCQGMLIDRCQFLSDESDKLGQDRVSIGFNTNANDIKIRDNRAQHLRHFAVVGGANSIFTGNHFFQGDGASNAIRTAGIILTEISARMTFTGNYVDNCHIEWANEHDPAPEFGSELSFSALSLTGNIFLASHVAPWFTFLTVRPHGVGHFINGLSVTGNLFRVVGGNTNRVETLDTSFAPMDFSRMKNITFAENSFNQVNHPASNPVTISHAQNSPAQTWTVPCAPGLPFGGWAQTVEGIIAKGAITTGGNVKKFGMPHVQTEQGGSRDQITLGWETAVKGSVGVTVRMDNPL